MQSFWEPMSMNKIGFLSMVALSWQIPVQLHVTLRTLLLRPIMGPSVFILRTLWHYPYIHLQSNVWCSWWQSGWAVGSFTTYPCAGVSQAPVTHSSLNQQKLVSIYKVPLWNFPLKNTVFSVLLFSAYLLTSGNISKRSFKKLLYTHWGQGEYIYWKIWMLPHEEQMRAINPGNSQSENTL